MCVCMLCCSVMSDSVTGWTVVGHTPLSMGFSKQEYWIGRHCHLLGDHLNPGIEIVAFRSPAFSGMFLPLALPGKPKAVLHNA